MDSRHPTPRSRMSLPALEECRIWGNTVSSSFSFSLDIAHQATTQVQPFNRHRVPRTIPSKVATRSLPILSRGSTTTFRQGRSTHTSTRTATLPHPSFPKGKGTNLGTMFRSSSGNPAVCAEPSSLASIIPDLVSYLIYDTSHTLILLYHLLSFLK